MRAFVSSLALHFSSMASHLGGGGGGGAAVMMGSGTAAGLGVSGPQATDKRTTAMKADVFQSRRDMARRALQMPARCCKHGMKSSREIRQRYSPFFFIPGR